MARKKDSPQKAALRELMGNYLKENNVKVKDGTDVNSIMRDMMSIILEGFFKSRHVERRATAMYQSRKKELDSKFKAQSLSYDGFVLGLLLAVFLISLAVSVYFAEPIRAAIPINLLLLLILVHIVYVLIRWYVKGCKRSRGYY